MYDTKQCLTLTNLNRWLDEIESHDYILAIWLLRTTYVDMHTTLLNNFKHKVVLIFSSEW